MSWRDIDHVVVLVQENLSFDRTLGWMRPEVEGADGAPLDLAYPVDDPLFPPGTILHPEPGASIVPPGAPHLPWDMEEQLFGAGFVANMLGRAKSRRKLDDEGKRALVREVLRFYRADDLPVYRDLARSFAVADRWFAPIASSTWSNRYFLHLGTSPTGGIHLPEVDGRLPNIFDRLTDAGLTWRIYTDGPATMITSRSVMGAVKRARRLARSRGASPEDADPVRSFDRFLCDTSRTGSSCFPPGYPGPRDGEEALPTYTFIEPRHWPGKDRAPNNDHHHTHLHAGQRLVGTIYNALRSDPARWARTLFVVTYDEHGGYWDHVRPPPAPDPYTGRRGTEFKQAAMDFYGGRVPAFLVSPHIRPGVYHGVCDHTSVLAFLERRFGLDPLTERDRQADDLTAAFADAPIPTPERIALPTLPAPVPPTGDHEHDFTGMALDLYRDLARLEGIDPEPEIAGLSHAALGALGDERARRRLRLLNADDPQA